MNKSVLASFNIGAYVQDGLVIRVVPIYPEGSFYTMPVRRCPNHATPQDPLNHDFWADKREHLIRVDNPNPNAAKYEEDPESKRLYVIIPVQQPQPGSSIFPVPLKFMCLGSDVGGINRYVN